HAWLYARAVTEHGITGPNDFDLLTRTFREQAQAREFFARQQWDFTEVEYAFLDRAAASAPGQFPEVLGDDYPPRGEAFLLERSTQRQQAGQAEPARAAVEVLLKLAPGSVKGHDRLACLHYRGGQLDEAVRLLDSWHRLAPSDHWPLIRQAIIEQERG